MRKMLMMDGRFGFGIPGLGMLVFWGAIILVVVFLARSFSQTTRGGNKRKSTREILDERYARGEIDGDEYEEKKRARD
jgi:putative membrane protein